MKIDVGRDSSANQRKESKIRFAEKINRRRAACCLERSTHDGRSMLANQSDAAAQRDDEARLHREPREFADGTLLTGRWNVARVSG